MSPVERPDTEGPSSSAPDDPDDNTGLSATDLGGAIRRARKSSGLSMVKLAARLDVSQSFLSQVENGRIYPSVSSLYRIADALGVSVGALMGETHASGGVVRRAGSAPTLPHSQSEHTDRSQVLTSPAAGSGLLGLLHTMQGDQIDESPYRHEGEDLIYVLEGDLTVHAGAEVHRLTTGDSLHIDGRIPHWWERASTPDVVRVLLVTGVQLRP